MELIAIGLAFCLFGSISLNLFQRYHFKINQKKTPPRAPDITAQEMLNQLTAPGGAVLRVEVLDTANLYLRSPRA